VKLLHLLIHQETAFENELNTDEAFVSMEVATATHQFQFNYSKTKGIPPHQLSRFNCSWSQLKNPLLPTRLGGRT